MPTEKDPKEHFIDAFRTPKTRNGNTTRLLVVYELTNGVRVVHACELSGDVGASLEEWTSNGRSRAAEWSGRVGEVNEISAKEAKAYLERARKLALRAIDAATKVVTFARDAATVLPPDNGKDGIAQTQIRFKAGERVDVTDLVMPVPSDARPGLATFRYRGWRRWIASDAFTVSP